VITFVDCEGAGEAFEIVGGKQFFGSDARLTVSSQLHAEIAAASAPRVFTFGPTFRAEKHNTVRHMSEFWMLEPEISFIHSLPQLMDFIEHFIKRVTERLVGEAGEDLSVVGRGLGCAEEQEERVRLIVMGPFERMTYREALAELEKHSHLITRQVAWGNPLQLEHEKLLAERIVGRPLFVTDYPVSLKPFYMRQNNDCEDLNARTVSCCDLLVPGLAEIVGGSMREERPLLLEHRMSALGMNTDAYRWYLEGRRWGGVPHGGFGLGFDRYLQYVTGVPNIRDVCLIPRTRGNAKF